MNGNRLALGRGLEALIPTQSDQLISKGKQVIDLPLDKIVPNPNQPRVQFDGAKLEELVASIREKGVIQPILVKATATGYQVIAGERRLRASKAAGLAKIPAIVAEITTQADELEWALIENLQREDLNPLEEAVAYQRLGEIFGYTHEDIAKHVGRERSTVSNALRLLNLPDEVQAKVAEGAISAGHARALLALILDEEQISFAKRIIAEELSVRRTEELINEKPGRKFSRAKRRSADLEAVEQKLRMKFGATVHIRETRKRGRIIFDYYGHADLNRILEVMGVG
ncbi:MAG: ParB/RepB/Spo0J family partition protein [candidate division Zixibacteria bacterium]|nr:ParB/RepB/Spo0J family partition protein [candidate division Zixibacteria bacterium]